MEPRSVSVISTCTTINFEDNYTSNSSVCINCMVDHTFVGTCVAIIHQQIFNSSYSLMDVNVIYLNRSGSDNICSGCIQEISFSNHVVVVYAYDTVATIITGSPISISKPTLYKTGVFLFKIDFIIIYCTYHVVS